MEQRQSDRSSSNSINEEDIALLLAEESEKESEKEKNSESLNSEDLKFLIQQTDQAEELKESEHHVTQKRTYTEAIIQSGSIVNIKELKKSKELSIYIKSDRDNTQYDLQCGSIVFSDEDMELEELEKLKQCKMLITPKPDDYFEQYCYACFAKMKREYEKKQQEKKTPTLFKRLKLKLMKDFFGTGKILYYLIFWSTQVPIQKLPYNLGFDQEYKVFYPRANKIFNAKLSTKSVSEAFFTKKIDGVEKIISVLEYMKTQNTQLDPNCRTFVVEQNNQEIYLPVDLCQQAKIDEGLKIPPKNRLNEIDLSVLEKIMKCADLVDKKFKILKLEDVQKSVNSYHQILGQIILITTKTSNIALSLFGYQNMEQVKLDEKNYVEQIENLFQSKHTKVQYIIQVPVHNNKKIYWDLKYSSYKKGITAQMFTKVDKLQYFAKNLLKQLAHKIRPIKNFVNNKVIYIGVDIYHSPEYSCLVAFSYLCHVKDNCRHFWFPKLLTPDLKKANREVIKHIEYREIIQRALGEYEKEFKEQPLKIVLFRDGFDARKFIDEDSKFIEQISEEIKIQCVPILVNKRVDIKILNKATTDLFYQGRCYAFLNDNQMIISCGERNKAQFKVGTNPRMVTSKFPLKAYISFINDQTNAHWHFQSTRDIMPISHADITAWQLAQTGLIGECGNLHENSYKINCG